MFPALVKNLPVNLDKVPGLEFNFSARPANSPGQPG
jgi:hypothetical protein